MVIIIQLEQERTQLNEEIASLKKECHEAVRESTAQRNKCRDLQHQHAQQLQTLQQQLYQVTYDRRIRTMSLTTFITFESGERL